MTQQSSLVVENVRKLRFRGRLRKEVSFQLNADFAFEGPRVVGVLGSNGAGKTTLFDLISGHEAPTHGTVFCGGCDVHRTRFEDRHRLVHHRQQRFRKVRSPLSGWSNPVVRCYQRFRSHQPVPVQKPAIHLFDEPDMKDEYMGLRVQHMHRLREEGCLVMVSLHPHASRDLDVIRLLCDGYLFVHNGETRPLNDFDALLADEDVREYLGDLLPDSGQRPRTAVI